MPIAAGSLLGPYEVLSPLGAGGMGEVWKARDTRLGREVAIKVLPAEVAADPSRLKRFEKEARSASALNHPNIVTIYDIGSTDSVSWIAMERVEGKTLRELLFAGPIPTRRLLSIAAQIADGLATAHQAGIVHRDLKPENVMVTKEGRVKILDFGLAKLTRREAEGEPSSRLPTETGTSSGVVLGTVGYMSPEQAAGQAVDFRSDQFSFGSILYEMATGKRAFQKGTAVDTLSAILHEDPKPLGEISPEAPAPLRWIVERCLAKDAEDRYAATRDLARDLAGVRDRVSEVSGGAQAREAGRSRAKLPRAARTMIAAAALLAAAAAGFLAAANRKPRPSAPSFHRLDFQPGEMGYARLTPDGQSAIYGVRGREGGRLETLYQARLDSPEIRRLDLPPADILSISSAGEMAIRLMGPPGPDMLARVPLAGGVPRHVVEGVPYASADWGPDGKSLAIIREVEGRSRLEYPIGKVLTESGTPMCCLRLSRDGREIAFWQDLGLGASLAIIAASGGERRVLTTGWLGSLAAPVWAPDGREVWFSAKQPGEHLALYAVDRARRPRLVARVPGHLELYDVTRDGSVLAGNHTFLISMMGTAPGESKERDLSCLDNSGPVDISSDGKNLLVRELGEGGGPTGAAYLRPTDGSLPVKLGDGLAHALSRDGAWVAVQADWGQPPRKPHFVILPTGAGESRSIANDTLEKIQWANWMPDGKRLVVEGNEPDRRSRLWMQDVTGGKPSPITAEGFSMPQPGNVVSPDGSLVVSASDKGSVLCPTAGGDPKPIPGWKGGDTVAQWSADGKALFVYRADESPPKVFLLDLATGQRRLWKEIRPADPRVGEISMVVITPDGSAYAYRNAQMTSHLYVIDGLR